jgi:hypothetical protein
MHVVSIFAALLAAGLTTLFSARADEAFDYLVESVCLDRTGALVPSVLAPGCRGARHREEQDEIAQQRHDWPAEAERARRGGGYQRSVSFRLDTQATGPVAVQTFDFGGGERRFGAFDAGKGDGGQAVIVRDGVAIITMTEDGSGGVQWFAGAACRSAVEPLRSGWVLFGDLRDATWRETVARLRIARDASACPAAFDASFTRWTRVAMDWPVLFDGVIDTSRPTLAALDTIVSEHFGGGDREKADHLERFFLVRGLGLVRWERWEQVGRSRRSDIATRAERLLASGRCPHVGLSEAPSPAWRRIDCRTWTNFVTSAESALPFGWRGGNP